MWHASSSQLLLHFARKLFVPAMVAALLFTSTPSIPDTEPLQAQGLTLPKFWRAGRHAQHVSFI